MCTGMRQEVRGRGVRPILASERELREFDECTRSEEVKETINDEGIKAITVITVYQKLTLGADGILLTGRLIFTNMEPPQPGV